MPDVRRPSPAPSTPRFPLRFLASGYPVYDVLLHKGFNQTHQHDARFLHRS
jgi:hypothetical protein